MINRRQILTGTAAAIAAATLPDVASEPYVTPFEPLYARLTSVKGSVLYSSPTAIRLIDDDKTLFFGVSIAYPERVRVYSWQEYPIEKISASGVLGIRNQKMIKINEKHYMEYGMTVAEMPQDMREIHDKWLTWNITEPHWVG